MPRLGELLVAEALITPDQLQEALQLQKTSGEYIGIVLMRQQLVSEVDVYRQLSKQRGIPFYENLREMKIPTETVDYLPREIAVNMGALPVEQKEEVLIVAMVNPFYADKLELLQQFIPLKVAPGLATRADLHFAINRAYNDLVRANPLIREFYDGLSFLMEQEELDAARVNDLVIASAHMIGAERVYLKFMKNELKAAFRIEGSMHNIPLPKRRFPIGQVDEVCNDLKQRGGMRLDHLHPQNGKVKLQLEDSTIQASISSLPLHNAEVISLQIDKEFEAKELDQLDLHNSDRDAINSALDRKNGIIIVTGPGNSGKTTTLYALADRFKGRLSHLISIEDRVDLKLPFASQVQAGQSHDLAAATLLRGALQQDADVLLLGASPDRETAELAIEAARSGSLVLMNIRAMDAVGALMQLISKGCDMFALSSALILVVRQQLLPRICNNCKMPLYDSKPLADRLGMPTNTRLYHGTGCNKCFYTGHKGRIAVFEVLKADEEYRYAAAGAASTGDFLRILRKGIRRSIVDDAKEKCRAGLISPQDLMKLY